jgi:hypothetical protein
MQDKSGLLRYKMGSRPFSVKPDILEDLSWWNDRILTILTNEDVA